METGNPILERYADRAPIPASTSSSEQPRSSQRIPPAIQKIIAELGLRYRPSAQADLEAHAATLALLCRDLADLPPHLLERAAREWAVRSPYLPKASDLAGMCRDMMQPAKQAQGRGIWLQRLANNNRLAIYYGHDRSMHWRMGVSGRPEIVHEPMPDAARADAMQHGNLAVFGDLDGREAA